MKNDIQRDFATYPRNFNTYKWFKPLLVGLLFFVFYFLFAALIYLITSLVFHTNVSFSGYDTLDFYSAAGAFFNCGMEAIYIPSMLLAALIVKDRPFSSYLSSMGGWRWKTFLKTCAAAFVIVGIPTAIHLLLSGNTGDVRFTSGGLILLVLLMPLLCIAEELFYRGYVMQTVSSWFKLMIAGMIVQTIAFMAIHPYNLNGLIHIAVSAVIYGLVCVYTKGIEASSSLHIMSNLIQLILSGFGYGRLTAEQSLTGPMFNAALKVLFLVFIIYADKKLHWFDEVQFDDIEPFNEKHTLKKKAS